MSQSTKIYVGNLSYSVTDNDLRRLFEQHGEVTDVKVVTDRETGRSKGFGFVTFETAEAAKAAIEGQNGVEFDGRRMSVDVARESTAGGGRRVGGGNRW